MLGGGQVCVECFFRRNVFFDFFLHIFKLRKYSNKIKPTEKIEEAGKEISCFNSSNTRHPLWHDQLNWIEWNKQHCFVMLQSIAGLMLHCDVLISLVLAEDMQIYNLSTAIINYVHLNQVKKYNVLWETVWCGTYLLSSTIGVRIDSTHCRILRLLHKVMCYVFYKTNKQPYVAVPHWHNGFDYSGVKPWLFVSRSATIVSLI